jgi:NAD(P)-dependent dehydrogenase (short-subunit alcohol dehydrogenase family)
MKNIALITGASSGLGKEFVRQIVQRGAPNEIWVIARRRERLEELVKLGVETDDTAARYDLYTELWSIVMDTKTILPLYHQATGIAWSDRINVETINPTYYHLVDFSWAE